MKIFVEFDEFVILDIFGQFSSVFQYILPNPGLISCDILAPHLGDVLASLLHVVLVVLWNEVRPLSLQWSATTFYDWTFNTQNILLFLGHFNKVENHDEP